MSDPFLQALQRYEQGRREATVLATQEKQSALLGGVFERWGNAVRPSRSFLRRAGPFSRLAYSAGALSVPVGGGYLVGKELGFFDQPLDKIEGEAAQQIGEHAPGVIQERNPLYGFAVDRLRR